MRAWLLAPLLLIATPASAQIWGGTSGMGISGGMPTRAQPPSVELMVRETRQIRQDIRNGLDSGQLTRREARQLRREAYQIDRLEGRFGRNGLSGAERAELAVRRQLLRDTVIAKRSDRRK